MIIVNMNKDNIYNFDNAHRIFLDDELEKSIWIQNSEGTHILGQYKTKERAKEVLEH